MYHSVWIILMAVSVWVCRGFGRRVNPASLLVAIAMALTSITAVAQDTGDSTTVIPAEVDSSEASEVATSEPATSELAEQDAGGVSSGGGIPSILYLIPFFGIAGLVFTYWKSTWVAKQEVGTDKMAQIAGNITEGAMSFLRAEYTIL